MKPDILSVALILVIPLLGAIITSFSLYEYYQYDQECLVNNYAKLCNENNHTTFKSLDISFAGNPIIKCSMEAQYNFRETGIYNHEVIKKLYLTNEELEVCLK